MCCSRWTARRKSRLTASSNRWFSTRPLKSSPPIQTETIALNIIGDNLWQIEDLLRHGSCDASYALSDKAVSASMFLPSAEIIPSSAAN
jgi:hypothetical protein